MPRLSKRLTSRLRKTLATKIKATASAGVAKGRAPRTGNYYHIVLRGNRRDLLISTVDDRRTLNQIAIEALQRFNATLHGYCLMTNQLRALVQIDEKMLVKALRMIVTRYSIHRRRHSNSTASVFERPYIARRIDSGSEFLNLLRFIHLTPVIANAAVEAVDYRWSSHRAYVGYKSVAWITTEFGLSLLSTDPSQARAAYHQFMAEEVPADLAQDMITEMNVEMLSAETSAAQSDTGVDHLADGQIAIKSASGHTHEVGRNKVSRSLTKTRDKLQLIRKRALAKFSRRRKQSPSSRFISIY